jgi:hypothetical protein
MKQNLKTTYGQVILKKGTILYHTSQEKFNPNPGKPMLFLTFHPSEWDAFGDMYITRVELLKDVSLLFMIGGFHNMRVLPLLDTLINKPGANLEKQNDNNLRCYVKKLKSDNFDGWLSSIEGKAAVEVALNNDLSVFKCHESEPIRHNWTNGNYINDMFIPKKWGEKYTISTRKFPAIFIINSLYKPQIEIYIYNGIRNYPNEYALQVVLENADITYFDNPIVDLKWDC